MQPKSHFVIFRLTLLRLQRLTIDTLLCVLAFGTVAILPLLRASTLERLDYGRGAIVQIGLFGAMAFIALAVSRTYRMIWRYISFNDLLKLLLAATLSVIGYFALALMIFPSGRNVPAVLLAWTMIQLWTATVGFLAFPRIAVRAFSELRAHGTQRRQSIHQDSTIALVTGDLDRIESFIRQNNRARTPRHHIVGVLEEDARYHNSELQGVPILGSVRDLPSIVAELKERGIRPLRLIFAKDGATRRDYEQLLELVTDTDLKIGRLAAAGSFRDGTLVQPIELSDLLGRPEIKIDLAAVRSMIEGRCVLITGAGGSIGSELSRQIARLHPSKIVLVDNCEFNLYAIDAELASTYAELPREARLLDIRDREPVATCVASTQPDIVFHAAALKHVPLLEDHPLEAVKTNVIGTSNLADACCRAQVPAMVTISTDKAVNPSNVMGATKRFAEAYCQALDQSPLHVTRFVTVRFGNVLGSNGSVVPLFKKQIEDGGPITVTDPNIKRYFMTIPEAVTLVMQAGAQSIGLDEERGSIYVLEMGEPVRIVDLARQMIRLSGYRPDVDIQIKIVGLRPGEKLFEEVAYRDEALLPTRNEAILKLAPRTTDLRIIQQQIQEIGHACAGFDRERVLRVLSISVPEYMPDQRQLQQTS